MPRATGPSPLELMDMTQVADLLDSLKDGPSRSSLEWRMLIGGC